MPLDDYFKQFSFRLIGLDVLFSTILVFIILIISPYLFNFQIFKPITDAISDFEITDVYFSNILPELDIPVETDIIIVNTGIKKDYGVVELNDLQYIKVLNLINQTQASAVAINHRFETEEDSKYFETIKQILDNTKNLVLISDSTNNISENAKFTFVEFDSENISPTKTIRKFLTNKTNNGKSINHFAVEAANGYNPDAVARFLERGYEYERINYIGNYRKFNIVSSAAIFQNKVSPEIFDNKIVLMGVVDTTGISMEFERMHYTPLNETSSGRAIPDMYDTIIHANIISMLLTDNYFEKMSQWLILVITFVLTYLNMLLFGYIGHRNPKWYELSALAIFTVETFSIAYLTVILFSDYNYEMDLTLAIITSAMSIVLFEIYTDTIKPVIQLLFRKLKKN